MHTEISHLRLVCKFFGLLFFAQQLGFDAGQLGGGLFVVVVVAFSAAAFASAAGPTPALGLSGIFHVFAFVFCFVCLVEVVVFFFFFCVVFDGFFRRLMVVFAQSKVTNSKTKTTKRSMQNFKKRNT